MNICIDPVLKEKGLKVAFSIVKLASIVNKQRGNENNSQNDVDSVLHEVVETIQKYCGGAVI